MEGETQHIGLFFGSFNPIHNGHLAIADFMLAHADIDALWLVVSPRNPFKDSSSLAPDADRLEMVRLALEGREGMTACDVEFSMPRPSYTIHTLRRLSWLHPDVRFELIIGSDCLEKFDSWKEADAIIRDYHRIVYPRPGTDPDLLRRIKNGRVVEAPVWDISSTRIRERVSEGLPVDHLMPVPAAAWMHARGLYRPEVPQA